MKDGKGSGRGRFFSFSPTKMGLAGSSWEAPWRRWLKEMGIDCCHSVTAPAAAALAAVPAAAATARYGTSLCV